MHGMNTQRNKRKWAGFLLSCWTSLKTSTFLVMHQALVMLKGGEGALQGSALQGSVSLASEVRCLSHAPLCPTSAFLHTLVLQCVFSIKDTLLNSSSVPLWQSFLNNCYFFALASSQVPKNASVSAGLLSGPGSK